jgi:methyltransferase (TIGR00027 family)
MRSGEPSVTARRVAAHRLGFDRLDAAYGDPMAEDRLAGDVAGDEVRSEGPIVPYLAARTNFFDRSVVTGLEDGLTQVVVAAAGYDGRALRYGKIGVRWFEIDHPDTQRDKQARIDRLGIAVDHISFVAADFDTDPVDQHLVSAGLEPSVPALMLCEGIAVYLDRPVLASLLGGLRAVAADGSRLAVSLSVSTGSPGLATCRAAFRAAVATLGEPARKVLTPDDAEALLNEAGWRVAPPRAPPGRDPERARRAGFVTAIAS